MSRSALLTLIVIIAILVVGGAILAFMRNAPPVVVIPDNSNGVGTTTIPSVTPSPTVSGNATFCTMDAKICPDGSAVGRIPPSCQFAACPAPQGSPTVTTSPVPTQTGSTSIITFQTRINQPSTIQGISLMPLEILEDSRCPVGVQCVWAGTVRVRVNVASQNGQSSVAFTQNTPIRVGAYTIELTTVAPEARQGVTIAPTDYRLTFVVRY